MKLLPVIFKGESGLVPELSAPISLSFIAVAGEAGLLFCTENNAPPLSIVKLTLLVNEDPPPNIFLMAVDKSAAL